MRTIEAIVWSVHSTSLRENGNRRNHVDIVLASTLIGAANTVLREAPGRVIDSVHKAHHCERLFVDDLVQVTQ